MEIYLDDILIKSIRMDQRIDDPYKVFAEQWRHRLCLNPVKCAFRVTSGKFLRFVVTHGGIDANPDKLRMLAEMQHLWNKVQHLIGQITTLDHFISRPTEKCLPFFKVRRGAKDFQWIEECQDAFEDLKRYLDFLLLLSKPISCELYLYLSISPIAIGLVLAKEEPKEQKPIHYMSRVLQDAKTRYTWPKKVIYALVIMAQWLHPYLQVHPMILLIGLSL